MQQVISKENQGDFGELYLDFNTIYFLYIEVTLALKKTE